MDRLERIAGCLLGGAVGDALGAAVEFLRLPNIRSQFGDGGIRDYSPAYGRLGAVTDDTQMTLFTLEGMLRTGDLEDLGSVIHGVRSAYIRWLGTQGTVSKDERLAFVYDGWLWQQKSLHSRREPGIACQSALRQHLSWMEHGRSDIPEEPINDSKGCGGVMRMAPVGFFDLDCFGVGCDLAKITHGHPSGYLSSGFLAEMINRLMHGDDLANAIQASREMLLRWPSHQELLDAIDRALQLAEHTSAIPETIERLGEGWVAEEALAISLFCALRAEDFAHGVRLAVNHGGDSDSTGAITGNILGAMWGRESIPECFLQQLELKHVIEAMASDAAGVRAASAPIPVPFGRSYWVKEGVLLAGYYPGDSKPEEARRKLQALLDAGIRTTLNLMLEDERGYGQKPFVHYDEDFRRLGCDMGLRARCLHHPIPDLHAPSRDQMRIILDHIDLSIQDMSPVYVHCRGGLGRTGAVVGCWLVRHGIATGDTAIEHIKHLRQNEALADEPSPQTPEQYDLIRSWREGE